MQDSRVDKDKFRRWIEGILEKTLQTFPQGHIEQQKYRVMNVNGKKYYVSSNIKKQLKVWKISHAIWFSDLAN